MDKKLKIKVKDYLAKNNFFTEQFQSYSSTPGGIIDSILKDFNSKFNINGLIRHQAEEFIINFLEDRFNLKKGSQK